MDIPLSVLGAAIACCVGWVIYDQLRLRRRRGLSRDEFAEAFRREGVPYKVAGRAFFKGWGF